MYDVDELKKIDEADAGFEFWMKIDRYRKLRNLRWQDVAERAGIPLTTLNTTKNSKKLPSLSVCVQLADYFGVSVDYLLGRKDSPMNFDNRIEHLGSICYKLSDDQIALVSDFARMIMMREHPDSYPEMFSEKRK